MEWWYEKRTKVVIGIGISLLILVLGGLIAGNYFYTLAIDAHSDKSVVFEMKWGSKQQHRRISILALICVTKDVWMKIKTAIGCMLMKSIKPEINGSLLFTATSAKQKHGRGRKPFCGTGISCTGAWSSLTRTKWRRFHRNGCMDSEDIVEWSKYILKQDSQPVSLSGVSMGASTVMMASNEQLPDAVKVAVEDCGYTSAWDEFSFQLMICLIAVFSRTGCRKSVTKLRAGYDLKDADASRSKRKRSPCCSSMEMRRFRWQQIWCTSYKAAAGEKSLWLLREPDMKE